MSLLTGFSEINEADVQGGKPITTRIADTFRKNDDLFEQLIRAMLCSPLVPNGADGVVVNPEAHRFVQATELTLTIPNYNLIAEVPLIWFATERITITAPINGKGKGSPPGQFGDFGGSGGGITGQKGGACRLPSLGHQIIEGGEGPAGKGKQLPQEWASRLLTSIGVCRGGAGGAGAGGGAGGGIVVLCAPEIKFIGSGSIDVSGEDAKASPGGGGGGGVVILIAKEFFPNTTLSSEIKYRGGTGNSGGDGGDGRFYPIQVK